jgi:hypothetical protein
VSLSEGEDRLEELKVGGGLAGPACSAGAGGTAGAVTGLVEVGVDDGAEASESEKSVVACTAPWHTATPASLSTPLLQLLPHVQFCLLSRGSRKRCAGEN